MRQIFSPQQLIFQNTYFELYIKRSFLVGIFRFDRKMGAFTRVEYNLTW